MGNKTKALIISWVLFFVLLGFGAGAILFKKENIVLLNCKYTEQVFITSAKGHKWPAGSVFGCRCTYIYSGKILIDYENIDRIFCGGD